MTPSDLLGRLATTFKTEIGPAVEAEFPRTQAFLSAVVLQKIAGQLRLAEEHAAAEAEACAALISDLKSMLDGVSPPQSLVAALADIEGNRDAGQCAFIEALYATRAALGEARFEALLGRVRATMRATLNRRLEYAA